MPGRRERQAARLAKVKEARLANQTARKKRLSHALQTAEFAVATQVVPPTPFGELVSRLGKGGVRHFGVRWLDGDVLHIDSNGVDVVAASEFEWIPVRADLVAPADPALRQKILRRGVKVLEEDPTYNLFIGNCEQVARQIVTGVAHSDQPGIVLTKGVMAAFYLYNDKPDRAVLELAKGFNEIHGEPPSGSGEPSGD